MASNVSDDSIDIEVGRANKRSVVSGGVEDRQAKKTSVVSSEKEGKRANKTSVVSGGVKKKVSGSISGHHFGEDELSKLGGGYLSLARELKGETKLIATGRKVVTEEDLAVFLMVLRFFTNNMNADGSLPVARWREMWRALNEAGDVERGWCHHRFARMRNFLSEKGLLSWEDEDFRIGVFGDDGVFVPGQAAKWRAGEELLSMMEKVELQEASVCEGIVVVINGEVEEREEGESTLYGHTQYLNYSEQLANEQDNHTQTVKTANSPDSIPNPGQSTSFQSFLDDFGLWIPVPKPRFAGYSTGQFRMAA
jgi:hypothetical protein